MPKPRPTLLALLDATAAVHATARTSLERAQMLLAQAERCHAGAMLLRARSAAVEAAR